jgi:hypothetical protein
MARRTRRICRELTPEEQARVKRLREQIADELPDLIRRDQMRKDAADEDTFSGELRRRIHRGGVPITEIIRRSGIDPIDLDEFLTGERTLPSSDIDQLVEVLGCKLVSVE